MSAYADGVCPCCGADLATVEDKRISGYCVGCVDAHWQMSAPGTGPNQVRATLAAKARAKEIWGPDLKGPDARIPPGAVGGRWVVRHA